jgi:hypothetical protein
MFGLDLLFLGLAAGGGALNFFGKKKEAKAQKAAEALRKQQMELEAMRKQREIAREATRARATAVANTTASGATRGGSSALPGALGQIASQEGQQQNALYQNLGIGRALFDANARASEAKGVQAIGTGLQNFGMTLFGQTEKMGKLLQRPAPGPWETTVWQQ